MSRRTFAVIPAAGTGSRFGGDTPKQYLLLDGMPLIRHTLQALLADSRVEQVVVVLAPEDSVWSDSCLPPAGAGRIRIVRQGGATRADSVTNGIKWLIKTVNVDNEDWVLVHDAARPCLAPTQLTGLIDHLIDDPVGGLLAIPVADTLKRADAASRVDATIERAGLWQAQTPQMFRIGQLHEALTSADRATTTDEASAIEGLGLKPRLVQGSLSNLKVTYPEDLALAGMILAAHATRSAT
jgi:2-C-methyl-D-erythritol 4-phosphate cytidylyltransferase